MNITWKFKLVAAAAALAFTRGAQAQQEIRIGVIYPLTGAARLQRRRDARTRSSSPRTSSTTASKGVPELPFAAGGGLPGLKGAKIKLVFADHQGNPQVGATEAERLISQEHVVALMGAYNSQRHADGQPGGRARQDPVPQRRIVVAHADAAQLQVLLPHHAARRAVREERHRVHARTSSRRSTSRSARSRTLAENTLFGNEAAKLQLKYATAQGYNVVKQVSYPAKTTQLTSEVQTLKAANPTVLLQSSYSAKRSCR